MAFQYPSSRKGDESQEFHGTKVPDYYKWLSDPQAEDVKNWVIEQNKVTNGVFEKIPFRGQVKERMTELYNYPKFSCPFKRGTRYYFYKNDGLQNQAVLYTQDTLTSEPRVFLDPNKLSDDGTAAIGVSAFSEAGDYWAYGVARKGSDWQTIYIKPTKDGEAQLPETLEWIKFSSIAWTHDGKGFFYARYPKPKDIDSTHDSTKGVSAGTETDKNHNQQLFYHKLNTPQSEDKLIWAMPEEPEWMWGAEVSDDGKYFFITVAKDTDPVNRFYYVDLTTVNLDTLTGNIPVVKLVDNFEAEYSYITNEGTLFYFKTNLHAPRYKLITMDLTKPTEMKDLVPQHPKDVLSFVATINSVNLILSYLHDVVDNLLIYDMQGKQVDEVKLVTLGTIGSVSCKKHHKDFFYSFSSFLNPTTIFHYDFSKPQTERHSKFRDPALKGFNADNFETKQVFYPSKDGTKIPLFLVHKKGLVLDGNNPVLLYGYGGFSISIQPYFSTFRVVWMQNFNGVFAVANIRGGGEYGEEWHQAGTKSNKQNVFDDFIAAGEWLVANKYTKPERLAITGGSNGGLLVGAVTNQRPDLFGVSVAAVGVMDMLNFHRYTIGYAWASDYGSADNKEDFEYLFKYSPVHNVKSGKPYPCVLLTTADHDDRVVPLHSYKYIAELQTVLGKESYQKNPLIIRIESKAGHSAGKPTSKIIEEEADVYSFIASCMGLQYNA